MAETIIDGTKIEHNGDVNNGLEYLRNHWNDRDILEAFEDAKTSGNAKGDFRIPGSSGRYILRKLGQSHYSLTWDSY